MALGFDKKSRTVEDNTHDIDASPNPEKPYGFDAEKGEDKGRKMSRVGGADVIADSDSQLSVGRQVELEASNAIKYRTCSWQKVTPFSISQQGTRKQCTCTKQYTNDATVMRNVHLTCPS